jgi:hypothetical protein
VFLIFSANKSGEFQGYARMETAIGDVDVETEKTLEWTSASGDETATPSWAAAVHRIDGSLNKEMMAHSGGAGASGREKWGKPFKVKWIIW